MFYNRDMVRNLIKEYADRIKEADNKSIETELMYLLYECELERIKWDTPYKPKNKVKKVKYFSKST
jgi:hypothetical protein